MPTRPSLPVLLFVLAMLLAGSCLYAPGEKLSLYGGMIEEGDLRFVDGKLTLITGGREIVLHKHRIMDITERGDTYNEYRRLRDATDMTDTTAMMELARWARERFLAPEAIWIAHEVLKFQRDHYEAREMLYYRREGDRWARDKDGEYRYREELLRCGDKAGYEELALWAGTNGVAWGVRDSSYYLLRMDPFHRDALKWAKPHLEDERLHLPALPLKALTVREWQATDAGVFGLFTYELQTLDGKAPTGEPLLSPVDGTIEYCSDLLEDDTTTDEPGADNYAVISTGGFRVRIGGFRKGSFAKRSGTVKAGEQLGIAGTPGGKQLPTIRISNEDRFSIPLRFAKATLIAADGTTKAVTDHRVKSGDRLKAGE